MSGMGSHQSARALKDEWLTPPEVFDGLDVTFDLDPCAPVVRPWPTAAQHYTIGDDGLSRPWKGTVWLNPPYGRHTGIWLDRLVRHGNGIALIFARTETKTFYRYVWDQADSIFFIHGRLHFHHADGRRADANAGAPSCLVAYGDKADCALWQTSLNGAYVSNWRNTI